MASKINKKGAKINALLDNMESLEPKASSSNDGFMSAADKEKLDDLPNAEQLVGALGGKQDTIPDLSTIRSGAAAGGTAYQKPGTGIPASDLSSEVQDMIENGGKTKSVSVNGGTPVTPDANGLVDLTIEQANVTIGTVTTGAAGSNAEVNNSGTGTAPVLDFVIPQGQTGQTGPQGPMGESVIVGEGDLPLTHVTGQATDKAMSQKGVTDAIDGVIDKILMERGSWDASDMQVGYYTTNTIGNVPSNNSTSTFHKLVIPVVAGGIYVLSTLGSANGRAWAFTGEDRKIISNAVSNLDTTSNPVRLVAEVDGYLYVNTKDSALSQFSLKFIGDKFEGYDLKIDAAKQELQQSINSTQAQLDADVANMSKLTRKATYGSELLTDEGFYTFQYKDVGETANTNLTSYATIRSKILPVKNGDRVKLSTGLASGNSRMWALTDQNYKILSMSAAGDNSLQTFTLEVSSTGYLFLGCKTDFLASFSCVVETFGFVLKSDVEEMLWEMDASVPKYRNNPLPIWKDTIRVLAVGNSYTDDSLSLINSIAAASGVDPSKFCVVRTWISSSSLQSWYSAYVNNSSATATTKMAGTLPTTTSNNFRTLLESAEWDIITFQEISSRSCDPSLFEPYLTALIAGVRKSCPNKKVVIGWNLIWRYALGFSSSGPQGQARWAALCEVAKKKIISDNGIDFIIPSGTAIENARNTSLNDADELTRDGTHLSDIGRYIVACTWWEAIMAPMFNNTVLGNSATLDGMTETQRSLAQQCAFNAVMDMWNLTEIEE